jgi:hypothetical protein
MQAAAMAACPNFRVNLSTVIVASLADFFQTA